MTCLEFDIWWHYHAQWGPLRQFEGAVHGAHSKPLQAAGKTQHLDLQWGEARRRACFIVIVGLESPPCLIGMDIMRPLHVRIDVTNGTATPAQPDPQTVHLNAVQSQQRRKEMPSPEADFAAKETAGPPQKQSQPTEMPLPEVGSTAVGTAYPSPPHSRRMEMQTPEVGMPNPPNAKTSPTAVPASAPPGESPPTASPPTASPCAANPHPASRALLFQTTDILSETALLVRCHNPWPSEDVLFCPEEALPAFLTGIPALSSGPELWIAIHNHRPEPLQLHSGQSIGVLEVVTLADTPPTASQPSTSSRPNPLRRPSLPERLSPLQQQQLNELFREFGDVFNQGEDDLWSTLLLEHSIETHGPPLRQPYWRQNPAV